MSDVLTQEEMDRCLKALSEIEEDKSNVIHGLDGTKYTQDFDKQGWAGEGDELDFIQPKKVVGEMAGILNKMRPVTKEERESVMAYMDSISEVMIPMSVIEDIKAEIEQKAWDTQEIDGEHDNYKVVDLSDVLQILDKHISGKENNADNN